MGFSSEGKKKCVTLSSIWSKCASFLSWGIAMNRRKTKWGQWGLVGGLFSWISLFLQGISSLVSLLYEEYNLCSLFLSFFSHYLHWPYSSILTWPFSCKHHFQLLIDSSKFKFKHLLSSLHHQYFNHSQRYEFNISLVFLIIQMHDS